MNKTDFATDTIKQMRRLAAVFDVAPARLEEYQQVYTGNISDQDLINMGFNLTAADFVSAFTLLENLIRFKDGVTEAGGFIPAQYEHTTHKLRREASVSLD